MKRVALIIGGLALATSGCGSDMGPEVDAGVELRAAADQGMLPHLPGLGEVELIDFGPDLTITSVFARLRLGIVSSPEIAERSRIEITITSVDGYPGHFHGTALIPVTDIVEVYREGEIVTGHITWTVDDEPQVVDDVYTACSTLQIDRGQDIWYGPERCTDFGPY